MAKKKNTSTFNPGGFRAAEEASMASFPKTDSAATADERVQLAAKGVIPKPVAQQGATGSTGLYYNYYTGEYVASPDLIKPRTGMGGAESGGGSILVTPEDYKAAGLTPPGSPSGKTVSSVTYEGTGKNRVKVTKYSDGSETREAAPEADSSGKKVVSVYTDPTTGDVIAVYDDKSTEILSKGTKIADAAAAAKKAAEDKLRQGQSAYTLLFEQFNQYGLGALVEPLKALISEGLSRDELTLRLRDTDAYKKRFAANAQRIAKGLRAIDEATYIGLEDQYQDIMRRYGLPETYYARGDMGRQEGFEKFIGGDVSPVELEDRIQTAQRRVLNAPPQVKDALTQYYGSDITNGDVLAYMLDPEKAIENIKRKVTAAEIGAGASIAGLTVGGLSPEERQAQRLRAEELGRFGVTGEQARAEYQKIAEFLPGATKLGDIYAKQGLGPYTQTTAEQEVFGISGAADAAQKRKKLAQLEAAQFSGTSGATGGALGRERAGQF